MKKTAISAMLLVLSCGLLMADFPGIRFFAPLDGVSGPVDGIWTVTVKATAEQTIDLIMDESTEFNTKRGEVLNPEILASLPEGTVLKIRADFLEAGLYIRELEVVRNDHDFELRGPVASVDCAAGRLVLFDIGIGLDEETDIRNADGEALNCSDLAPEQLVEVKGNIFDSEFWATEIKAGVPGKEHLLMEFDALILEMADDEWLVAIRGEKDEDAVPVRVLLDENTEIDGDAVVGSEIEITGILTPELAVLARLITVEEWGDPDPGSGDPEGGSGPAIKELAIKWAPDVIKSAQKGTRTVQLMIKYGPAGEDLTVQLSADFSPDLVVVFPGEVVIPQGKSSVDVEISIESQTGTGTITATLPGGASDDLSIELKTSKKND